ncbi:hypothetical protein GOV12_07455 [Candidatus Pacearchaeota archaeon]|nr:hypothetical protein [Candidatus Pacearchaeota archaeon]
MAKTKRKPRGPCKRLRSDSKGFVNEELRLARLRKKFRLKDLSLKTGLSLHLLSQYESLRTYPTLGNKINISTVLGVSHEILFPEKLRKTANFLEQYEYDEERLSKDIGDVIPNYDALNHLDSKIGIEDCLEMEYDPEESEIRTNFLDRVIQSIDSLDYRGRTIIRHRYKIDGCKFLTFDKIGEIFGVCGQSIRQSKLTAFQMLKGMLGGDYERR